jgi:hypothetical protein
MSCDLSCNVKGFSTVEGIAPLTPTSGYRTAITRRVTQQEAESMVDQSTELNLDENARRCLAHVYRLLLEWGEESASGSDDPGQEPLPEADDAPAFEPGAREGV